MGAGPALRFPVAVLEVATYLTKDSEKADNVIPGKESESPGRNVSEPRSGLDRI